MKKVLLVSVFLLICIYVTAQNPTDFYIDLSKSSANDSVRIAVSVPIHVNIGYEVLEITIKEKGAKTSTDFKLSSRFPKEISNNLNVYEYTIPFKLREGIIYEVVMNNSKLCNAGPFKITEEFSSIHVHTFSYANPGYKLTSSIDSRKD